MIMNLRSAAGVSFALADPGWSVVPISIYDRVIGLIHAVQKNEEHIYIPFHVKAARGEKK